jgi:prephenate dehydrogenase
MMEDGFTLQDATIGIFGLGLMGGSLAMSLNGYCAQLVGFDIDLATLELALAKGVVDQAELFSSLHKGQGLGVSVDILILATPVSTIINILQQLPSLISYPCIVMDLGSTKRDILRAMSTLPGNFDPIGGHPICGKEKLGLENADADLYQSAAFVITPLGRTTQRAKSAAQQVISTLRAKPIEMSAEDHDRVLATTSHLPFLISSSLVNSTPPEFSVLIGSGYRSTSRLAGTPASMMMGVLKSNRENILQSIQQFCSSLGEMETALQNEDYAKLETILNQSRSSYLSLISTH